MDLELWDRVANEIREVGYAVADDSTLYFETAQSVERIIDNLKHQIAVYPSLKETLDFFDATA